MKKLSTLIDEIEENLKKYGAPSDDEIAQELEDLHNTQRTPTELKQYDEITKSIEADRKKLAEIKKEREKIKRDYGRDYFPPSKMVKRFHELKSEERAINRTIEDKTMMVRNLCRQRIDPKVRTLQYDVRKNLLVKILIHRKAINEAIEEAKAIEFDAIDAAGEICWTKYNAWIKNPIEDQKSFANSFYCGLNAGRTDGIELTLSQFK